MKFPYKVVIGVLLCMSLILGIYSVYYEIFGRIKKQVAVVGTIEDLIESDGYIMRDEVVIANNSGSVVDSLVADAERVRKGQQVAIVYNSSIDQETKAQLKALNERIINIEKNIEQNKQYGTDSTKSEPLIKAKTADIIKYAHLGQGSRLSEIKSELEMIVDEVSSNGDGQSVLQKLKSQKQELEAGIKGEKTPLYAEETGMYFPFLDGGENVLLPEQILSMTVGDYNNINSDAFNEKVYTGAKIVRDFKWYYVTVIDTKKSMALEKGKKVSLRFNGSDNSQVDATIYHISKDEAGKTLVAFEVYEYDEYAFTNRHVKVDVVVSSATGLKFLKDAVKVDGPVTGVYVVEDSVAKFRQVEILGTDDKYVVVKADVKDYKSVELYDEIVVKGDVENNKIVK